MTKALLRTIQAEYEHTDATIDSLCAKYNCTTKDLRGYTTWNKNIVAELDTSIKLVYETVYAPQHDIGLDIEDEEDVLEVYTEYQDFAKVRNEILRLGYVLDDAKLIKVPKMEKSISDSEMEKAQSAIEKIEELEDVQDVWTDIGV